MENEQATCDECGKEFQITPFSPLRENKVGYMVCLDCDEIDKEMEEEEA